MEMESEKGDGALVPSPEYLGVHPSGTEEKQEIIMSHTFHYELLYSLGSHPPIQEFSIRDTVSPYTLCLCSYVISTVFRTIQD